MTTTGPRCRPTPFSPGDRVIYAGFMHGEFLRYSDFCCSRDHVYHPGHRIAVFQPDPTPHQQTGELVGWSEWRAWECDLTPEKPAPTIHTYLGVSCVERETAWEVNVGNKIVCMLSDAVAAVTVTSITYRDLDLTRHGLGHAVHVVFGYQNAPWWVDQQQMTADITRPVYVAVEPTDTPVEPHAW